MQKNRGKYDHTWKNPLKKFVPSPIPNGRGHFLSLYQKFLQKNNVCWKTDDPFRKYFTKLYSLLQKSLCLKLNKGHILLPDTVRFICEANGYDAEKIGQYFLEILPKICPPEER